MRQLLLAVLCVLSLSASAAEPDIELTVSVKAPVAEVWKAWTTAAGITSFFAPEAEIDARPDGDFHVFMDPYAAPGMKGADDMRVLAVETEKLLSFTWNAPPSLAEA
ncbi:MAG: SRPBCC domain-containing protein, partial [Proteobacteria bacterium]|nr:SRPBCC domain-containing protein [Pseudomonadota bacterium]